MSLSPYALTTLSAVKDYLKIKDTQTVDDARLESLINAASVAIENYCRRYFAKRTYTNEEYDGNGLKYLYLKHYPVTTVTAVKVNEQDITGYKVQKENGKLIRPNATWPKGDINITVTYEAGYTTIPYDLELACKHLVMSYFKADIASFSTTFSEGFVFRAEAFPSQVKAILQPYRKWV